MLRAAILVGIQRAPHLPTLSAVWDGVEAMNQWAEDQSFNHVEKITDQSERVRAHQISDVVESLIDPNKRVDQLVIYFSGHGINLNYSEFWLLSDAPNDPNAAVNVAASVQRARYSGVPHVVFISDACRTAASSIQAGGMTGSVIFHNPPGGSAVDVDVFYGTTLGEPALEIRDPQNSVDSYLGVYTHVLAGALRGQQPSIIQHDSDGHQCVRPRPLSDYLKHELPIRVFNMTRRNPRSQKPDSVICSDADALLSLFTNGLNPIPIAGGEPTKESLGHAEFISNGMASLTLAASEMLEQPDINLPSLLSRTNLPQPTASDARALDVVTGLNARFADQVNESSQEFGPEAFETGCGFKVRGARIVECYGYQTPYEILIDGTAVGASVPAGKTVSTLVCFDTGLSALIPVIGEFVTGLTFNGTNLVDVTYEPSTNSSRWPGFRAREKQIRNLRAVVAASARIGTFRLEGNDADKIARQMQIEKGLDPSLALYAAHAYRVQGQQDRIRNMARFMRSDLGMCLFDIALMSGRFSCKEIKSHDDVRPFLPILAQTWPLLPAYDARLPSQLEDLPRHVTPDSLWTVYDEDGKHLISQLIESGDIQ